MSAQASDLHRRDWLARLPLARTRIGGIAWCWSAWWHRQHGGADAALGRAAGRLRHRRLLLALLLGRPPGRAMTLALAALSCMVSLRYLFWRLSDTLDYTGWVQTFLGTGLLLAEIYAVMVLVLGYIQTAWPLDRKPVPLPDDLARVADRRRLHPDLQRTAGRRASRRCWRRWRSTGRPTS